MYSALLALIVSAILFLISPVVSANACIDCHTEETPNIVADWQGSAHFEEDVDCRDCHRGKHKSAEDVAKLQTVTADTCGRCHEERLTEFSAGKHALSWAAVESMPTTHALPMSLSHGMKGCGGCHKLGLKDEETVAALKAEGSVFGHASCDACHTRHTFSVEFPKS